MQLIHQIMAGMVYKTLIKSVIYLALRRVSPGRVAKELSCNGSSHPAFMSGFRLTQRPRIEIYLSVSAADLGQRRICRPFLTRDTEDTPRHQRDSTFQMLSNRLCSFGLCLCTLCLLACQVRVAVGDSGLCCCVPLLIIYIINY